MADAPNEENAPNRIMVYLRIRPAKKNEINPKDGTHYLLEVQPDNKSCLLESKPYPFDYIFDGDGVDQNDIYFRVAKPVIDNVFKGFWGACMVYGQTGTGKSFTMCNFDPKCEGIIPRAMRDMFEIIEADKERVYTINFSFIQIYLDKLQDLFNPDAGELKMTRDKNGVAFPGIVSHVVKDGDHFRELYEDGHQHRVITATKMNPESSRGHAALFIQVNSVPRDDPGGENRQGKLFLIDLAGYERFSKTGAEGLVAQEAKTINGSLLALGSVVQGLSDRTEHVPWRNAKLTRMLEDAIGGKAKCSIILTAGPSSEHLHETMGTLYFGSRAMAVKTEAKLAVNIDYKKLAAKLQEMLSGAESKINAMEIEATRRQLEREEAESRFQSEWARVKQRQEDQLQELLKNGGSPDRIQELINFNQQENELLEEQHYAERHNLEERHEMEVKESMEKQQEQLKQQSEATTTGMSRDLTTLQKELAFERAEKEKFREKAKDAESEARRLTNEVNDLKVTMESSSVGGVVLTGDDKKAFDRKIESIKAMLEENFTLKMQEVEEPLREELEKYQKLYDDVKSKHDDDIQNQKDALTTMYEQEIAELRSTSHEVQERLKKNHVTIKKSYQLQKERLDDEVEELTATVTALTKQISEAGMAPAISVSKNYTMRDDSLLTEEFNKLQAEYEKLSARKVKQDHVIYHLRAEIAMLAPAHFAVSPMPKLTGEYLSYLLGNFGDGVGRKYRLNAASTSFFTRLQTRLIPFSHAPATSKEYTNFNYSDASYLVFEKTRLKWGIFGSKALKDAVMATSGIPIRGILKLEEDSMYIALTAQGKDVSSSIAACKGILNAIHYEISALTSREFRGIKASYQELDLAGCAEKRQKLNIGIQAILTRFEIPKDAIATQLETIKGFQADPKHCEIENALLVLPRVPWC